MLAVDIKNLTFAYDGGAPVLRDICFEISAGETFVIAGPSGSGKTTLCNILCGVIPNAVKGDLSGHISIMGIDPREAGLPQTALCAGMVFQDAESQIICTTVEDELAFALENLRSANPNSLSGGRKKLLTIAAVLAPSPPILILDEPMSGLDADGRELILKTIEQQRSRGMTVIIVEHDLGLVEFADRWLLLRSGEAAACGKPSDILQDEKLLKELRLI